MCTLTVARENQRTLTQQHFKLVSSLKRPKTIKDNIYGFKKSHYMQKLVFHSNLSVERFDSENYFVIEEKVVFEVNMFTR